MTPAAPALTHLVGSADVHGGGVDVRMQELLDAICAAMAIDVIQLSVPGILPEQWSSSEEPVRRDPAAQQVVVVPVHFRGRTVGRATAIRRGRPWTDDQIAELQALGAIAAVVLHRAHRWATERTPYGGPVLSDPPHDGLDGRLRQ